MQMTPGLVIGIVLRIATFAWPLLTETLALFWWARSAGPSRLPTLLMIAAYLVLVFTPNRFLLSRWGVMAVMLLLSASSYLLFRYWSEPHGVPEMIWVHLGFGLAWLATLGVERIRGDGAKSIGSSDPEA